MLPDNDVEQAEERFRNLAVRTYSEYSMLPSVVTIQDYNPEYRLRFEKFAQRIIIDHWMQPDYIHDILFHDLGRTIGLSERKYILDRLAVSATPVRRELNLELLAHTANEMVQSGHTPTAILLPVQLYQDVHARWDPTFQVIQYHPDRLSLAGMELRIFWSNKFVPFRTAYLVSRDYGIWTARPSAERRLEVIFRAVDPVTMDVTIQSVFNLGAPNPEAVRAFEIPNLPEDLL